MLGNVGCGLFCGPITTTVFGRSTYFSLLHICAVAVAGYICRIEVLLEADSIITNTKSGCNLSWKCVTVFAQKTAVERSTRLFPPILKSIVLIDLPHILYDHLL